MRRAKAPPERLPLPMAESDLMRPETALNHQEHAGVIARAMARLPPEQRWVIELT